MMKTRFIIVFAIVFCMSCKKDIKPNIQREFLKSDWIIKDKFICFIEDSLVLFDDIYSDFDNNIYKYSISNDTLFFRPYLITNQEKEGETVFKIKELTNHHLILELIINNNYRLRFEPNKIFNFVKDTLLANNKSINIFEFSSRNGMGGRIPNLDMRIEKDSMVYVMNLRSGINRYHGLYQHKLSGIEFERINRKINQIELDSLKSDYGRPDAPYFQFLLKTNDSLKYKYSSCLCNESNPEGLRNIFQYLYNIEWLLKFEKSNRDTLVLQRYEYSLNTHE